MVNIQSLKVTYSGTFRQPIQQVPVRPYLGKPLVQYGLMPSAASDGSGRIRHIGLSGLFGTPEILVPPVTQAVFSTRFPADTGNQ
ncbi:hypothetical protein JY97_13265 [Alkalispirochaeta odontotermitis]|nr:hypothetical protein JY97_13265 [Alkalispirochaeta odontotermitis]CAB1075127.1 hypothetical protein D1AOALGA4SA_2947 [Olavius algarvensis Delta 1 endosymbiont]